MRSFWLVLGPRKCKPATTEENHHSRDLNRKALSHRERLGTPKVRFPPIADLLKPLAHEKGGGDCSPPPSSYLAYRPFGLLEAVVRKADQAPSEAGSILKPGPMVEDRLIFFT